MQINIGKADRSVDVDVDSLAPNVLEYVIRYGLTQIANDAHSQVTAKSEPDATKRADMAWELANKKLDALKRGELRSVSGPRAAKDPVKAIALEMAMAVLKARPGVNVAKLDKAKVRAWQEDYLVRNPELMDKARARHEETVALAGADDGEIDIDALMGDAAPDAE